MKTDWNELAEEYTKRGMDQTDWNLGYVKVLEMLENHERILDFGCGSGKFTRELAKRYLQIYGIDPSNKLVSLALQQSIEGIDYHCGSDLSIFSQESIDAAVSTFVFCTIEDKNQIQSINQEIYRMLKPGGRLVILEPHPQALENGYQENKREQLGNGIIKVQLSGMQGPIYDYSKTTEEYVSCISQAGFRVTNILEPKGTHSCPQYLVIKGIKEALL
jgi:ubiquinone/menaquinone biosynthesis C-methylase UbiE